jgi:hypothetical protein
MYSECIKKSLKNRRKLHTDTKEREARNTRAATIFTSQNESTVTSCEDVNTNCNRTASFLEDYKHYCPPAGEAM